MYCYTLYSASKPYSISQFIFIYFFCFITTIFCLCIHYHVMYRLILGDGSNEFPFIISILSKISLSVLSSASNYLLPCVLDMDSTFKCNENELQVTSLGISDAQRHFHLLSISVVSHHTHVVYCQLISSLQELVSKLVSVSPFPFSIL
jgi:hypothetical protein